MADLFIPVLFGSGREERRSEAVAKYVFAQLHAFGGVASELFDVRDLSNPVTHASWQPTDRTAHWRDAMAKADGLLIVTPEYNHGYPGELKIALDSLYEEYRRKPLSICAVSSGAIGGARVVEQLRLVAAELWMVSTRNMGYFMNVKTLFDANGAITDPSYADRLKAVFTELTWYARALGKARAEDPYPEPPKK